MEEKRPEPVPPSPARRSFPPLPAILPPDPCSGVQEQMHERQQIAFWVSWHLLPSQLYYNLCRHRPPIFLRPVFQTLGILAQRPKSSHVTQVVIGPRYETLGTPCSHRITGSVHDSGGYEMSCCTERPSPHAMCLLLSHPAPSCKMAPNSSEIEAVGQVLLDTSRPLPERFRALFTLRNLGGSQSVEWIGRGFGDESALLKHELAYCLGQMRERSALPILIAVLRDGSQEPMVRHEAGEALGAIGDPEMLEVLKEYSQDPVIEVAETCQLAMQRIKWLQENPKAFDDNPYLSVDPTPPSTEKSIPALRNTLVNDDLPLFERYRAMFALRNIGGKEAVLALTDGLNCGGSLFRHEIGYVLGQMQHEAAVQGLSEALSRMEENPMVRHECAEALGSIAREECLKTLREHIDDVERVVRESCEVALDMYEYENSGHFQYANSLSQIQEKA